MCLCVCIRNYLKRKQNTRKITKYQALNNNLELLLTVVVLDRNSDFKWIISDLIDEMRSNGMEVYYRDWVGIIQGYSQIYKAQVLHYTDYNINVIFC